MVARSSLFIADPLDRREGKGQTRPEGNEFSGVTIQLSPTIHTRRDKVLLGPPVAPTQIAIKKASQSSTGWPF